MVEFALENNSQQLSSQQQQQQQLQPQPLSQTECIGQQLQQQQLTGAIPRTPARLPEDVTALAEREINNKDRDLNKNAVAKTYHTLKDLISGKFKKENLENNDELNNVVVQQQQQQQQTLQQQQQQQQQQLQQLTKEQDDYRSPYSALPAHMRQMHALNQSQPNIWNGEQNAARVATPQSGTAATRTYAPPELPRNGVQQRANSQPQLNLPMFDRNQDRRGSLANIDVTDSDEGGFASSRITRRPQTMYQMTPQQLQQQQQQQQNGVVSPQQQQQQMFSQRNSPQSFHANSNSNLTFANNPYLQTSFQHSHLNGSQYSNNTFNQSQQQIAHDISQQSAHQQVNGNVMYAMQSHLLEQQGQEVNVTNQFIQSRQDALRASFQKQLEDIQQAAAVTQQQQQQQHQQTGLFNNPEFSLQTSVNGPKLAQRNDIIRTTATAATAATSSSAALQQDSSKLVPGSAGSSDYDKSGNQSSNVDSGRGSAAYSSGRKAQLDTVSLDSPGRSAKNDDSEWVDIVDAELRHILEPGMQGLAIRPESTVSGSVSSMSPPLPPLSPGGSSYKPVKSKDKSKQEYGTDSYNRPGRGPIGPSRAGWPGASVQKHGNVNRNAGKKHEQTLLKRHLFGLDNDLTSTTTRSLDLESILGGPWGTGQSVSDSETDTQGIRHIRSQLEGLENMYGEVLKMLGSRGAGPQGNRMHEAPLRGAARRRHGSLSSLPSSSVSGRPIRDRRRTDDRRKVRDMKGINKRFQRLESHVVTLARSVAHLSSEMRSQHLVTQELERLRDDLTTLRSQAARTQHLYRSTAAGANDPEPPNLTNPRRVKKLTKFFGEDPPLMRLFLKNLGYEKYANLFEAERVGMIELPYLGEERLQKLGVPLGPRLRILQEAQISLCKDTTLCIV